MDKQPDEFRRLNQQLEHLKKMVARYKQAEDWENLTFGDKVMIDNSDSIHDGAIGKFVSHQWSSSGYVCLLVEFEDDSRHHYLPIHLVKHYEIEKMTAQDLEPLRSTPKTTHAPVAAPIPEPQPAPVVSPEPEPVPEKKGVKFRLSNDEELLAQNNKVIEAKLAQIAKMPMAARKSVLSSTLDAGLVPRALEIAVKRGIIPASS